MFKPFDLKRLTRDRDGFVARLELAFALERRPPLVAPRPPPPAEADTAKKAK